MSPIPSRSALTVLALLAATPATAAEHYAIYDMGSLTSFTESEGYDIDGDGAVVGYATAADGELHAVRTLDGVMTDLGLLPGGISAIAIAANDANQVVGNADWDGSGQSSHAFLFSGGSMIDLGTFGGPTSSAADINDAGRVVGMATTTGSEFATWWTATHQPKALPAPNGVANWQIFNEANAINASGDIVGTSPLVVGGPLQAVLWEATSTTTYAEPIPLGVWNGNRSSASDINDAGVVVGSTDVQGGTSQYGFRWEAGTMSLLEPIGTDTLSEARAINEAGDIVGLSYGPDRDQPQAVMWRGNNSVDLRSRIPNGHGWGALVSAEAIDDQGRIAGWGYRDGTARAFLMVPIEEDMGLSGPNPGWAGIKNQFTVEGAQPNKKVWLLMGTQPGSWEVPGCPGLFVDFADPMPLVSAFAGSVGVAQLDKKVSSAYADQVVYFQAVQTSSCTVSNRMVHRME